MLYPEAVNFDVLCMKWGNDTYWLGLRMRKPVGSIIARMLGKLPVMEDIQ